MDKTKFLLSGKGLTVGINNSPMCYNIEVRTTCIFIQLYQVFCQSQTVNELKFMLTSPGQCPTELLLSLS